MDENRVSPSVFLSSNNWIRFSSYEVISKENIPYILPKKDASWEIYNPFDFVDDLLKSLFELKRFIKKISHPGDINIFKFLLTDELINQVLLFVNKYGLSGLYWIYASGFDTSIYPDKNIIKINNVKLNNDSETYDFLLWLSSKGNNYVSYGNLQWVTQIMNHLPYKEYASTFFPKLLDTFPNQSVFEGRIIPKEIFFKEDFWRFYGEPIVLLVNQFYNLFSHFDVWNRLVNGEVSLEDTVFGDDTSFYNTTPSTNKLSSGIRVADIICSFQTRPTIMCPKYNESSNVWQIEYEFKSLYDALTIMYAQKITTQKQRIKSCILCNKPFIAKSPYAKYCSTSCGINERVRRHRKNSKDK